MALPSPLPDDPRKWDGWKLYDSPDAYERLCLSFDSHPSADLIEEHSRQLLIWWQKKLPLKHQPSNPLAQLLRGGMDTAPFHIAEARAQLLDPQRRMEIDAVLAAQRRQGALLEFQKFLDFALADQVLTKEAEVNLNKLSRVLGLQAKDTAQIIQESLERTGATREADEQELPAAPAPMLSQATAQATAPSYPRRSRQANPQEAYRRMLKLSGLDAASITLEHRDGFADMAEQLDLDPREAEDLVEEYLGAMSSSAAASARRLPELRSSPVALAPTITAFSAMSPARSTRLVTPREQLSPEAERRRFPAFANSLGAEMLLITTGRFLMGSHSPEAPQNELPATRVTLRRFYLSRHPITSEQYQAFDSSHATRRNLPARDAHPAVLVSYFDAVRFCEWLSAREDRKYRLPTEAEWEYAARGTEGRTYPWASTLKISLLKAVSLVGKGGRPNTGGEEAEHNDLANFARGDAMAASNKSSLDVSDIRTSAVGEYPRGASLFGVEDLAGNVWEWCQDFYAPYQGAERMNPTGPPHGTHRVCRGGSWKTPLSSLKATTRGCHLPTHLSNDLGFRIVCECN